MLAIFFVIMLVALVAPSNILPGLRAFLNHKPGAWILWMRTGIRAVDVVERHEMESKLYRQMTELQLQHLEKTERQKVAHIVSTIVLPSG